MGLFGIPQNEKFELDFSLNLTQKFVDTIWVRVTISGIVTV